MLLLDSPKPNLLTQPFICIPGYNQSSKGSNEIASAVYDTLNKIEIPEVINKVKLIADECSGQNKNSTIMAMAAKWLSQAPRNIKKVQLVFPVTGHSFLPADRVFALIEKEVKKLDTIILPDEYYDIFKKYGTLKKLNYDWHIQDWKKETTAVIKSTGALHFKIKSCKRIVLTRSRIKNQILVQAEPHFNSDVNNPKTICKQGKSLSFLNPQNIVNQFVKLKPKKIKNVGELLIKHYGQEWMEQYVEHNLQFYKTILRQQQYARGNEDEGEDEDLPEELLCSPGDFVEDNSI